jgi:hypothetical protein
MQKGCCASGVLLLGDILPKSMIYEERRLGYEKTLVKSLCINILRKQSDAGNQAWERRLTG